MGASFEDKTFKRSDETNFAYFKRYINSIDFPKDFGKIGHGPGSDKRVYLPVFVKNFINKGMKKDGSDLKETSNLHDSNSDGINDGDILLTIEQWDFDSENSQYSGSSM